MELHFNNNQKKSAFVNIIVAIPIIFIVLFQNFLQAITGIGFLSNFDELLVGLVFLVFGLRLLFLQKFKLTVFFVFVAYAYFTAISFLGINFYLINVILQNIIHLKFFILVFAFVWLFKEYPNTLKKCFLAILWITTIGVIINLIFQERFNNWVGFELVYRNDFLRLAGFQVQPNNIGITLGVFYLYYLLYDGKKLTYLKYGIVTIIFIALVFLTGSRTPLLLLPITFSIFTKQHFGFILRSFVISLFLLITVFSVILLKDTELYEKTKTNIAQTISVDESNYTRGLLLYYSTVIARNNFPIGAGAGSFGTKFSEGSKVYQKYGLTNRHFTEMQGVYESNFASILGEFGLMGIIIYSLLLRMVYKSSIKEEDSQYDKQYFIGMIAAMVIFHFTKPIFMNSYPVILFSMAIALKSLDKINGTVGKI